MNVGATPQALEIFAFAPGVDPATLEINLERGLMTIAGERKSLLPDAQAKAAVHINERFEGPFRRVLTLPDDADPEAVEARLRDGVLRITVRRRASAQPRRIAVL
ncbi:Spore protein SP21 [compost metagenome]